MLNKADLRHFWLLSGPERLLFLRAVVLLVLIGGGLRLLGFRRLQAHLSSGSGSGAVPAPSNPDIAAQQAQRTAFLVSAAARHGLYRATCLPTSLALRHLLQRQGLEADLRVGVRKSAAKLEAHAWVEHQGMPLIDGPDVHEHFAAFEQPLHPGEEVPV